ncbi:MAG: hypothetical protein J1E06_01115, partial [Acutalibacter sp.]|nr:hypothetical protein [Acutalibacter sp.]
MGILDDVVINAFTEAPVPAESITIDSVTLNEPSFTDEDNDMVEEVVAGESVDMTFTVLPEDTTDEAEVTADNGATASKNE